MKGRRRAAYGAVLLSALAALWVPPIVDSYPENLEAGVVLELFTVVPLLLTVPTVPRPGQAHEARRHS